MLALFQTIALTIIPSLICSASIESPFVVDILSHHNGRRTVLSFDIRGDSLSEAVRAVNRINPALLQHGSDCSKSSFYLDSAGPYLARELEGNGWCSGNAVVSATERIIIEVRELINSFQDYSRRNRNGANTAILTIVHRGRVGSTDWVANQRESLQRTISSSGAEHIAYLVASTDPRIHLELTHRLHIESWDASNLFVFKLIRDVIMLRLILSMSLLRSTFSTVIVSDARTVWLESPLRLVSRNSPISILRSNNGSPVVPIVALQDMSKSNVTGVEALSAFQLAYRNVDHKQSPAQEEAIWEELLTHLHFVALDWAIRWEVIGSCEFDRADTPAHVALLCGDTNEFRTSIKSDIEIRISAQRLGLWLLPDDNIWNAKLMTKLAGVGGGDELTDASYQVRLMNMSGLSALAPRHSSSRVVKIVLMQKDESTLLADWLYYHCSLVGIDNVHVIDHMSTDTGVLKLLQKMRGFGLDVRYYDGHFTDKRLAVSALMNELSTFADIIVPLDCDEFIVLATSSSITTDTDAIRGAFDDLPMDGRSYKFSTLDSSCPGLSSHLDPWGFVDSDLKRRALWRGFSYHPSEDNAMSKTFYPGGSNFQYVDAGSHFGGVIGDFGAGLHDKMTSYERYFVRSNLTILHFQTPPLDEWKTKCLQRAIADGFDTWDPIKLASHDGYNAHYGRLYSLLNNENYTAHVSEYETMCLKSALNVNVWNQNLSSILKNNPLLAFTL